MCSPHSHFGLDVMIKNPNALRLQDVIADLPKHVWDSSAEPPAVRHIRGMPSREFAGKLVGAGINNPDGSLTENYGGHPLARKAVKVKRKKGEK